MNGTLAYLQDLFTPDLDPAYLWALVPPLAETVAMAAAAMAVVVLLSVPLAVAAALNWRGARAIVGGLAVFRSVPDLTLAILCVIFFGIGPGAGVIALMIYYTAAVSKIFADLLETAPRQPLEALVSTGASQLQVVLFGLLPLSRDALHNYGAVAFECALRSSVIVGAVGGGGIGTELVGSIAAFDFSRASTQILMLVVLIAALDRIALYLRTRSVLLVALLVPAAGLAVAYAPRLFQFKHALVVIGRMVPPTLGDEALGELPRLIFETVVIAVAGTASAAAIAAMLAFPASRRFAPGAVVFATRRLLEFLRTIPELVWGLLVVSAVGIGPLAGILALCLHSAGTLGRIFGDLLDTIPERPHEALVTTGARRLSIALFAGVPLSFKGAAVHTLFRFDWNLRMAAVLGAIGAGGIGEALYQAQQLFFYREVLAYLLITVVLVLATERLSRALRTKIGAAPVFSSGTVCAPDALRRPSPAPIFGANLRKEHA
jgi:phosphonate transport system permease protein